MIHRLMNNNITSKDRDVLVKFIQNTDYFTNGKKVKEFEEKWSTWVGTKYSVFVKSFICKKYL